MTNLNDRQVRDAALNLVDDLLDITVDGEDLAESVQKYFSEGWAGFDEDGEWAETREVSPDSEDVARIGEEAESILGHLRDRTDSYYD
jgi:geranylgeranyl pyrophosphate synthase